jgi:hypothetical protein
MKQAEGFRINVNNKHDVCLSHSLFFFPVHDCSCNKHHSSAVEHLYRREEELDAVKVKA